MKMRMTHQSLKFKIATYYKTYASGMCNQSNHIILYISYVESSNLSDIA